MGLNTCSVLFCPVLSCLVLTFPTTILSLFHHSCHFILKKIIIIRIVAQGIEWVLTFLKLQEDLDGTQLSD